MLTAELQELVAQRVPLNDYDKSLTVSGDVRAWNHLRWNLTTTYEHAGWLHVTTEAGFRLTREGRAALKTYADGMAMYNAANHDYQAWDSARSEQLPDVKADASTDILHGGSGAAHVMRACCPVITAWRKGDSAFSRGTPVWSAATASALSKYLESAAQSTPPTLPGLEDSTARTLAAESLVLLIAPFSDLRGSTKRTRVRNPLMPALDPPGLPWRLSADLDHGFVHGGSALAGAPVALLQSCARLLNHWWSQPSDRREKAFTDPWAFRDLVTGVPDVDERIGSLLCLVTHPKSFTSILRRSEREQIVSAFASLLESPTGDLECDLKTITLALQAQQGGKSVHYDTAPVLQQWSQKIEGNRAWLIRGELDQQNRVPAWTSQGQVTLTVGRLMQLPTELSQDALSSLVEDRYADLQIVKREAKKRDVLAFALGMQPDDLVVTVDGGALRLGRVQDGPAKLQSIERSNLLVRPVVWFSTSAPTVKDLPGTVRKRMRFKGEDIVDLTDIVGELESLADVDEELPVQVDPDDPGLEPVEEAKLPEPPIRPAVLECDTTALAAELFHADASWLEELLVSLNERKQVVLEGPPGTGKTFLVQRLLDACGVVEGQSALVQFHPTYSYEDFVEGFRPVVTSDGPGVALTIQPGPLKRIADEARNAPGKPFVLVVDEINRANIAKVFGELYFLLEYRDAEIELLYSGADRFRLPANLFIIGTMNTADRSIALLDAAMRRRFVFMSMDTNEPALGEVLKRWSAATDRPPGLAQIRERLNMEMLKRGLEQSLTFGPSYFMRPGLETPDGLDRLWRRELRPMLIEHHFGDHDKINDWYPFRGWMVEYGLDGASAAGETTGESE
jgi:5-methylcytosine-specific restriction protein B